MDAGMQWKMIGTPTAFQPRERVDLEPRPFGALGVRTYGGNAYEPTSIT